MNRDRLSRDDWMRAARRALLTGGPDAVRVERLAAALHVTKGSFYWHFVDRAAVLEALLCEWEDERAEALAALPDGDGPGAVRALFEFLAPRVTASERGESPSDAAIFAWASSDRRVAARVNTAEAARLEVVRAIVGDHELGEFLYLTYVGFITRRRRAPASAVFFPTLAKLSEQIAKAPTSAVRSRTRRRP